jgi:ferritin-like metal-binding protein YciE
MTLQSLTDLFLEELQDLYDAEQQLVQALPLMAEKAFSPDLQECFQAHFQQTQQHVTRIEEAFKKLKVAPEAKTCKAMKGIIAEAQELLEQEPDADPSVLDAALIGAAQKAEHYEIASYGTICTYARTLQATEIAKLLRQTLDEEFQTDSLLTELAEQSVNLDAAESDQEIQREAAANSQA